MQVCKYFSESPIVFIDPRGQVIEYILLDTFLVKLERHFVGHTLQTEI